MYSKKLRDAIDSQTFLSSYNNERLEIGFTAWSAVSQTTKYDGLVLVSVLFFTRVDKQDDTGEQEYSEREPR